MLKFFDLDLWEEIYDSLYRNKSRTLLTAFGIFWGVFMLVLLMGGGKGLERMLVSELSGFATNSGFLFAGTTSEPYKGFSKDRNWSITMDDVDRLRASVPELEIVTPNIYCWGKTAKCNNRSCDVTIVGIFEDYMKVDDPKITNGRELNIIDIDQNRKVCVVGSRIVEELFPDEADPCGKFIDVDGVNYCIVGVSGKSANGISIGSNATKTVYLPYTTTRILYNRGGDVDVLCLTARGNTKMSEVQRKAEIVLKRAHFISPNDTQAVFKLNTEEIFNMIDSLFSGVSVLVWMIGLGTLFAGAVGVSNIMVVTVKERTTEIGIRRAIGARTYDILVMIMFESVVLTLMAGMSGMLLAVLILQAVEAAVSGPGTVASFQVSFQLAVGASLLVALLGGVAGLAPAMRAMSIKPVDAMRDE